ncbi:TetR/AcrR family transcriptional regulator [Arthrobacter sp. MYb213]|uniref:TetR/AcrR family transcriptional regulator n=1 Tax=Arthrobacter sp. MYb213 TaxID=1848595 RepID=UPI000CFB41E0|nr:TetR/AcrR family transcriptional regulator [Arthrobacter sp. MYb213]PRB70312.1 TetR family transcriptional regulator [Arthrobacter sp. MYb213]
MQSKTTVPATGKRSAGATRERILEATNHLFYAQGIRATSADRIIEEVGITKVTFYRHFRSKSDLVVAYLAQQAQQESSWFSSLHQASDPVGSLDAIAAGIGTASCSPGFRGCAFINAAAEFSDPQDPVREVVHTHRQWMLDKFAEIASDAGTDDSQGVARQLMMLRDGAMVNGYLGDPKSLEASLKSAFDAVLTAAIA